MYKGSPFTNNIRKLEQTDRLVDMQYWLLRQLSFLHAEHCTHVDRQK
ncbi:hypothetical protein T01_12621 [Trichinella spiralis]|uniref:Uncharacterized protein n=1 Tax=Trichinella spiralis TaxID=6334 RepID=A0A0V0Z3M9_TRISP|nr:hypothetical protein T01_12621 [Trichinella spiralis]